jgi:hypothetical protein
MRAPSILMICPRLYNLLTFISVTMSSNRYTFCSSKLVLILHTPCSHFGPYIFRKIFLSHVIRLVSILPVIAQVSLPYNTTGLIIVLYILIFLFLDIYLVLKDR